MQVMLNNQEPAENAVKSVATLPPLPANVTVILNSFGNEFIEADQVCDTVAEDPAVCARLLGLANSAYFCLAEPVTNIRDAVSRVLGVDTVRSLVLAMAVQQSCKATICTGFDAQKFWMHALMASACCTKIAGHDAKLSDAERELAGAAGLCHNLGLMALAHLQPLRTTAVLLAFQADPSGGTLSSLLEREFGFNHKTISVELSRHWCLPQLLVAAYERRAFPQSADESRLGQIVIAAAAAVGNTENDIGNQVDLSEAASSLDLTACQLQDMAIPAERQANRLQSLAGTMA